MRMRPDDWTTVVRANVHRTKAWVVSSHDPMCLQMAKDEVKHVRRWMEHATLDALPKTSPDTWFMAVVVCPGDDLADLATWMERHGSGRVRFYFHQDADISLLEPIRDAGHDLRHVRPEKYATYGAMHHRLGLDLSDQVYEDFAP